MRIGAISGYNYCTVNNNLKHKTTFCASKADAITPD